MCSSDLRITAGRPRPPHHARGRRPDIPSSHPLWDAPTEPITLPPLPLKVTTQSCAKSQPCPMGLPLHRRPRPPPRRTSAFSGPLPRHPQPQNPPPSTNLLRHSVSQLAPSAAPPSTRSELHKHNHLPGAAAPASSYTFSSSAQSSSVLPTRPAAPHQHLGCSRGQLHAQHRTDLRRRPRTPRGAAPGRRCHLCCSAEDAAAAAHQAQIGPGSGPSAAAGSSELQTKLEPRATPPACCTTASPAPSASPHHRRLASTAKRRTARPP